MSAIHLYSYQACPFARRTRMTLIEKGLDFELTEIDINNKPDNFATISPYGKVPVLLHGGERIYESSIINEYLDETYPAPPLMPGSPIARAQARIWMDYCGSRFSNASWNHMKAGDDKAKLETATTELHACLRFIENEGLRTLSNGPYWLGDTISLVDIQFIPFFQRFLNNNKADIPDDCTRVHAWLDFMEQQESFIATAKQA
jgi:glutathione S-transferase